MYGVELFCGAGGMSLGAEKAGINVLVAVDVDQSACETFQRNHPSVTVINADIRSISICNIPNDKPVILFGGPPCQGFSTSNQRTRNKKNKNNWLFEEFMRVARDLCPDWIVFENVKGILETEKGEFVKYILSSIESLGYFTEFSVLNSSQFNVPQFRNRFILIARRQRLPNIINKLSQTSAPNSVPTVWDAIGDLPRLSNGDCISWLEYSSPPLSEYSRKMRGKALGSGNHFVTNNAPYVVERYKHIPQGGNWENIPSELMSNYKDSSRCHTGIYYRLKKDSPSPVIGNYRKNMLIHPLEHRGLSVREAARLQSFPDSYEFVGSIGFQQQQVGNAVPPLMAEAIFKWIVKE